VIVDTSALLAVLFAEADAPRVLTTMHAAPSLAMSTVNLCEVLVLAADRKAIQISQVARLITPFAVEYVAPDVMTATIAAAARLRLPLNFGDCFAYALAKLRNEPLLTLDKDFAGTDVLLA
jgi:ribonuclease VapC